MAARKSLILATVDCLRADHCGFMGYPRPTTPFLDRLARESLVFPTAIVAGVPTYYSFPAILASRYPLALGREVLGLAPQEQSLTSILKEQKYATAFFGAGNPYLSARFGYDFGFDTFRNFLDDDSIDADFSGDDLTTLSRSGNASAKAFRFTGTVNGILDRVTHNIPGMGGVYDELYFQYCQRWAAPVARSLDTLRRFPAADVIVDQARTWLASVGDNPFFLWLHFMDPHSPYYPTERGLEMFEKNRSTPSRARYLNAYWSRSDIGAERLRRHRDEVVALYDSGIRWVDEQISRLVDALRRFKLWDNCVFALTADHGEEFLEHDRRYHAPSLTEKLIHVPMVLRLPETKNKIISGNPFSLLHLAPTLLAALDLPAPAEFQGRSHLKNLQEGIAWSEPAISECIAGCTNPYRPGLRRGPRLLSVREAQYKLLLNFDHGTDQLSDDQLFDLQSDPDEQSPLPPADRKPHRRRLLEIALAHLRTSSTRQNSQLYLRSRLRDIGLNFANLRPTAAAAPPATTLKTSR